MIAEPDLLQILTEASPDQGISDASQEMILLTSAKLTSDAEYYHSLVLKELEFKFQLLETRRITAQNEFDDLSTRAVDDSDPIHEKLLKRKLTELNKYSREIIMIDNLLNSYGITQRLRNITAFSDPLLRNFYDDDVNVKITIEPHSSESSLMNSVDESLISVSSGGSFEKSRKDSRNRNILKPISEFKIRSPRRELSHSGEYPSMSSESALSNDSDPTPTARRKERSKPLRISYDDLKKYEDSNHKALHSSLNDSYSSTKVPLADKPWELTPDSGLGLPKSGGNVSRTQSAQGNKDSPTASPRYIKHNDPNAAIAGMVTLPRKRNLQRVKSHGSDQPTSPVNLHQQLTPQTPVSSRRHAVLRLKNQLLHGERGAPSATQTGTGPSRSPSSVSGSEHDVGDGASAGAGSGIEGSGDTPAVKHRIHMFEELSSRLTRRNSNPSATNQQQQQQQQQQQRQKPQPGQRSTGQRSSLSNQSSPASNQYKKNSNGAMPKYAHTHLK
ncbi:uncharacterized protein LOC142338495 isoform X3 [Convolutriloba macropyga]|uniref:uncharacterized protein LOC142338495 isoform X3 n=1 Tax=Convolutriloba macropyga TaxID=536237 RepID=UPI003F51C48A